MRWVGQPLVAGMLPETPEPGLEVVEPAQADKGVAQDQRTPPLANDFHALRH